MFQNAKTYNPDDSLIYKQATCLERVLFEKYRILMIEKDKLIQNFLANRPINSNYYLKK